MEIKGFKGKFENQRAEDKEISNKLSGNGVQTASVILPGCKLSSTSQLWQG
jgi:hypothetical protein